MIGLSFLQYKNTYGTDLYRQGELKSDKVNRTELT